MSIFDKSVIKEISMNERFKIGYLSFDDMASKSIYMSGDPLSLLIDQKWIYPYWRAHMLESKTFEDIAGKLVNGQIRNTDTFACLNDIHRYDMRPEGFSCTCDGERVFIDGEKLFPNYRDTFKETTSLFARLLTYSIIKSNIDVFFTPENYCPDNSFTYFDGFGEHFTPYWYKCVEMIVNTAHQIINPDYTVSIIPTIAWSTKTKASVCIEFQFIGYKGVPLQWWYCDRSKVYNWLDYGDKSYIKHMTPKFNVYFDLRMIEQE